MDQEEHGSMTKKEKFVKDLTQLLQLGEELRMALFVECYGEDFLTRIGFEEPDLDLNTIKSKLPNFNKQYQGWYSEALALLKQILPDRVEDFRSHYEYPRVRKDITFQNYMIRDKLQGLRFTNQYNKKIQLDGKAAVPEFEQQLRILESAKSVFASSLFDMKGILQADMFDSEIDGARSLAKAGFLRSAGVICGVVIEKHLKQVCENHNLVIRKKNLTIGDLNDRLKNEKLIDVAQWRSIQHLADIRNICGHDKEKEPVKEQVEDLVSGTSRVVKTIF